MAAGAAGAASPSLPQPHPPELLQPLLLLIFALPEQLLPPQPSLSTHSPPLIQSL